jgi:hypothetical protein
LKVPVKPETVRSGLIGMFEGLLRDMVLARRTGFPANYTKQDVSVLFDTVIAALLK